MYSMQDKEKEAEANGQPYFGTSGVSLTPISPTPPSSPMSKLRILKNLIIVSVGFLFLFTSFQSLSNLQSSLNKDDGLGPNGLSTIYGALVVSCLLLPPVIIDRFGCKWTIAFSMGCYILYMVANFYAVYPTIIPAAVILGLGAAPLWSAKCTYLTETGCWFARLTGASEDDVINRFFGLFFMIFQTSQIWGNMISSLVFKKDDTNVTELDLDSCGANFCPDSDANNTNLDSPPMSQIYTLCGIYVGFAVVAVAIIALFLDPITLERENASEGGRKFSFKLVFETVKHLIRSDYQVLLVVLTMYSGIEQAFMTGDYTKSFVGCALGIENIGFVMICYGVVDALCSFTFGRLVEFFGHIPFFILAFLIHGGLQITFLKWSPSPDKEYLFYVFAALWGMGDAVIQTQLNALYGLLWTKESEAAFANYRLWESAGFIIAFGCQSYLCTDIKIYICMGFLCAGMVLYGVVEVLHRSRRSSERNTHL